MHLFDLACLSCWPMAILCQIVVSNVGDTGVARGQTMIVGHVIALVGVGTLYHTQSQNVPNLLKRKSHYPLE